MDKEKLSKERFLRIYFIEVIAMNMKQDIQTQAAHSKKTLRR
jgi:hypothetical protein